MKRFIYIIVAGFALASCTNELEIELKQKFP